MRYFAYAEPAFDSGVDPIPIDYFVFSERELREEHFPAWKELLEKHRPGMQIDFEEYLEDWKVVHWAFEAKSQFIRITHHWFPGSFYVRVPLGTKISEFRDLTEQSFGGIVAIPIMPDLTIKLELEECEIETYVTE